MKKNWLSYICVATLLSGALTSCNESNFLDLSDPNHFTENNFWKNKADAESGLAAAYSPIKYQMNGYYGAFDGWLNLNSRGDDIFTILNEEASMWAIATFQNSSTTGNDPYGALYAGIQRANLVLKNIDLVPATGISEEDRSTIKGEALFLRGFQYFLLVHNYKEVPLRVVPSNEDESNKPAAKEEQPAAPAAAPAASTGTPRAEMGPIDFSKVEIEPLFTDFVDFETFAKSDYRAVKVKECTAVPKSKKLLKFVLDDGTGTDRVILSGIHDTYEPEELVGKTLIAITNLPPRKMMGIDSCGMIISAVHHEEGVEKLHCLMVDDHIPAGAKLY